MFCSAATLLRGLRGAREPRHADLHAAEHGVDDVHLGHGADQLALARRDIGAAQQQLHRLRMQRSRDLMSVSR